MEYRVLERRENGIEMIELADDGLRVVVSNLGCHILSVYAKDRDGNFGDVVLGYRDVEDCFHDSSYMGAVVGRVANRIGDGEFFLNGKRYQLAKNNGKNHLHGGERGFDKKIFEYQMLENGIRFHYLSPDGEEGYPGALDLYVSCTLDGERLNIRYEAECDQDTIINITNHMYFNLSAGAEKIYGHKLQIDADRIACVDDTCLATGEFLEVDGTPFDFRSPQRIGEQIGEDHEQLRLAGGYDHSYLLNGEADQIVLRHEGTGRTLTISTTMPAVQVYTANFLSGGCDGKCGRPYEDRDGVALETQLLPNSIRIEEDPGVILRKGEVFRSETSYAFGCRK